MRSPRTDAHAAAPAARRLRPCAPGPGRSTTPTPRRGDRRPHLCLRRSAGTCVGRHAARRRGSLVAPNAFGARSAATPHRPRSGRSRPPVRPGASGAPPRGGRMPCRRRCCWAPVPPPPHAGCDNAHACRGRHRIQRGDVVGGGAQVRFVDDARHARCGQQHDGGLTSRTRASWRTCCSQGARDVLRHAAKGVGGAVELEHARRLVLVFRMKVLAQRLLRF